ncbi:MAG TPA: glutathione peroxidase [Chitinophagaceae bacterium]
MTVRQRLLRIVYPFFIHFTRLLHKNIRVAENRHGVRPVESIYELSVQLNNGAILPLSTLRGKKILLVNTASDCGYTAQYADLQKLYQHSKEDLVVIGFPSNDFKDQEKGSDEEIARFCSRNFGVSFPLAKKTTVVRNEAQHPVFQWLTTKELNGWNSQQPVWNFSKYLVNEEGVLTHYFDPSVLPVSDDVLKAINQ